MVSQKLMLLRHLNLHHLGAVLPLDLVLIEGVGQSIIDLEALLHFAIQQLLFQVLVVVFGHVDHVFVFAPCLCPL